jgi:transmembrane sensor
MENEQFVIGAIMAKDPATLSQEERDTLNEWLKKDNNQEIFDKATSEENKQAGIARLYELRKENDRCLQKLYSNIGIIPMAAPERKVIHMWHRWSRFAIAASVVVMAVAAVWIFNHNTKTSKATGGSNNSIAVQKDIPPGATKAVLTLADGSKIYLDSAGNGKLADQAGITISNQNGQLVYKQNGGAVNGSQYNTLATAKGETFVTQLADGTLAWLNAGSSIHYPVSFTGSERVVEITGEVYFEVAHDASKPFHVKVHREAHDEDPVDIQVLGTHFNVNAYNDEEIMKTTLLEGSVKISAGDKIKILKPEQQAQVSNKNEKDIRVVSDVNTDEVIAWKNGFFNFEGVDIPAALRQVARWYNIEIVYEGEIPRDKFMGGLERNLSLSEALKVLEQGGLEFTVQGRKLIVKQQ